MPEALVYYNLATLGPLDLIPVTAAAERDTPNASSRPSTPRATPPLGGAQQRYLFHSAPGYLGAASIQSASFALKDRDHWIGWSEASRRSNLARKVANACIPIRPGVRVPYLDLYLLDQLARRPLASGRSRPDHSSRSADRFFRNLKINMRALLGARGRPSSRERLNIP